MSSPYTCRDENSAAHGGRGGQYVYPDGGVKAILVLFAAAVLLQSLGNGGATEEDQHENIDACSSLGREKEDRTLGEGGGGGGILRTLRSTLRSFYHIR